MNILKINIFQWLYPKTKKHKVLLKTLCFYRNSPFVYLDAFLTAAFLVLAGLLLPKELLKRLPLAVFLSPLPIILI
jgi:hypothetical protein